MHAIAPKLSQIELLAKSALPWGFAPEYQLPSRQQQLAGDSSAGVEGMLEWQQKTKENKDNLRAEE